MLREGEQLAGDLRDLSASLRTNAERLLRDVRMAAGQLNARLEGARTALGSDDAAPSRRGAEPMGGELDVPEFLPRK